MCVGVEGGGHLVIRNRWPKDNVWAKYSGDGVYQRNRIQILKTCNTAKKHYGKVLTFYAMVFQLLTISSRPVFIKLVILEFLDRGFHVFHNFFSFIF